MCSDYQRINSIVLQLEYEGESGNELLVFCLVCTSVIYINAYGSLKRPQAFGSLFLLVKVGGGPIS